MNIFVFNAGGFNAIASAVVAAPDFDTALALANAATDPSLDLTFHGIMTPDPVGTCDSDTPHVINIHQWGLPNLPSAGSGRTVRF